jgi:hypothetical protein
VVHQTGGLRGAAAARLCAAAAGAISGQLHFGAQTYRGYDTAMVSSERYIELVARSHPEMAADIRRNPAPVVPRGTSFQDALLATDGAAGPAGVGFLRIVCELPATDDRPATGGAFNRIHSDAASYLLCGELRMRCTKRRLADSTAQ